MKRFARLRRPLGRITLVAQLIVVVAWLLVAGLKWSGLIAQDIGRVESALWIGFMALVIIGGLFRLGPAEPPIRQPSARWSGTSVVVATGILAALLVGRGVDSPGNWPAALAILLATAVVATLVWRFATAHAGDIGEARFTAQPPAE